jgi:hypothetical protein
MKNEAKLPMVKLCISKPFFIPCEKFDYAYFNGMYNSNGINITVTTNFINTKAAAMLYPRAISNLSCYQNPLMSDITFQIDGKNYPYSPGNSFSTGFIKQNMEAARLNDYFHSTQSVEDSQCKGKPQAWGVRGRLDSDNKDWFHIITLQKPSAARQGICVPQAASELHINNKCSGEDQWKHVQLVVVKRRRPCAGEARS